MSLGLGIFAFVLVCVIGIQFMLNKEVIDLHEGFSSSSGASGTTRAADCNCLPGYIASNSQGEYDGKVYSYWGIVPLYIPNGTKDIYTIDFNNTCGILPPVNIPNEFLSMNKYFEFFGNYFSSLNIQPVPFQVNESNNKGVLTCDVVKKTGGKNYFCQNLGDPTKTRSCY